MKYYIKRLLRESLINEELSYEDKIINFLKSGDESNIELAYAVGKGQKINVDELVKSIYGEFLLNKAKGKTIKDKLINLTNLDVLGLPNNKLTNLEGIDKLTNLESLGLSYNKLTNLEGIDKLTNLKRLYLSYNELTNLPKGIDKLTNLERLSLHNNKLTTLPKGITNLTNLKYLYLSNNELSSLKGIEKLTNLERLSLHNNPISDEEIERIQKLLPDTKIY